MQLIIILQSFNIVLSAQPVRNIIAIAHRGAPGEYIDENSLSAIESAIKSGFNEIEIDLRQTKDSFIVLLHDKTISRTTNARGRVSEMLGFELFEVRLKKTDEKVPQFEDVLRLVDGRCKLLIELKCGGSKNAGFEKKIVETIRSYNADEWCAIQSFNDRTLENINKIDSSIALYKIILAKFPLIPVIADKGFKIRTLKKYKFVNGYCFNYHFVSRSLIKKIHSLNKTIYVWTVNSDKKKKRLIEKGVDGIISDL